MISNINVRVFNGENKIFEGNIIDFLNSNHEFNEDFEDYLLEKCESLNYLSYIKFEQYSGHGFFKIEKI